MCGGSYPTKPFRGAAKRYRSNPRLWARGDGVEKADDDRAERAYQRSLNNVPDQKSVDPWGTARGDDESKKSAAPAKPVVKQSSRPRAAAPPISKDA